MAFLTPIHTKSDAYAKAEDVQGLKKEAAEAERAILDQIRKAAEAFKQTQK